MALPLVGVKEEEKEGGRVLPSVLGDEVRKSGRNRGSVFESKSERVLHLDPKPKVKESITPSIPIVALIVTKSLAGRSGAYS